MKLVQTPCFMEPIVLKCRVSIGFTFTSSWSLGPISSSILNGLWLNPCRLLVAALAPGAESDTLT